MRVALAQTNIIWEGKNKNIKKAEEIVTRAKKEYTDMVLFPEMSFTGFSMNTVVTSEHNRETVDVISGIAKDKSIAIGCGWVESAGIKSKNHYTVISETGDVLSDYVKIHPFSYSEEDLYFESGSKVTTFDYKGFCWSTLICYDLRFPELFQIASSMADIIVVPANWPQKRELHWNTLLCARAIENQTYVLGVNCVGNIGGIEYSGCTSAYDYEGNQLGIVVGVEDLLIIDIHLRTDVIRKEFPVKKDRKWSLYSEIYRNMK